jgi:hypothetical protein
LNVAGREVVMGSERKCRKVSEEREIMVESFIVQGNFSTVSER